MIKYNANTLQKIETLLVEAGYKLRYEKGNFNSGFCLLEHQKIIVLNKFLTIEGRISTLIDLLSSEPIEINIEKLSYESEKILKSVIINDKLIVLPKEEFV